MNSRAVALLTAILLPTTSRIAVGQTLTVSNANVGPLTITTAVAGSNPTSEVNSATTYNITNPGGSGVIKLTAQLSAPMPTGTTLFITLAAPTGATSLGPIALTTARQDVVVNIPEGTNVSGLAIIYTFAATATAGVVPSQSLDVRIDVR